MHQTVSVCGWSIAMPSEARHPRTKEHLKFNSACLNIKFECVEYQILWTSSYYIAAVSYLETFYDTIKEQFGVQTMNDH